MDETNRNVTLSDPVCGLRPATSQARSIMLRMIRSWGSKLRTGHLVFIVQALWTMCVALSAMAP